MTEFEDELRFTEEQRGGTLEYRTFTVTFHQVSGGNADTEPISPSRFALPPRARAAPTGAKSSQKSRVP